MNPGNTSKTSGDHPDNIIRTNFSTIVGIFLLITVLSCADQKNDFTSVVQSHLEMYPEMQVQDLYKLSFHASMGNAHFLSDTVQVLKYLEYELSQTDSSNTEPLLVNITPDGTIVRLHLAPFKAMNGDPQRLVDAMFASAEHFTSSTDQLRKCWMAIESMGENNVIPFSRDSLHHFWTRMDSLGFPAVHHSETYSKLYSPHYRLLLRSEVEGLNIDSEL